MKKVLYRCYMNMGVLCTALYGVIKQWLLLVSKGQMSEYEILQTAHRLEKGLLNSKPKPMWGWDKARRLGELIKKNNGDFSTITGGSVLSAYLEHKRHSANEREREMASHSAMNYHLTAIWVGQELLTRQMLAQAKMKRN